MIIGSGFIFLKNAESTNTYAAGLVRSGSVEEGTVIHTNFQSAGRGQKGNTWESEDGKNLLLSTILFPNMIKSSEQFLISMLISLGICDFLKMYLIDCKIKWPNDIYTGNDKIAGILIENSITGDRITGSVAGIGLNINQENFPDDIQNPVSLKMRTGEEYDLKLCLKHLVRCLDHRYKQLISGEHRQISNEYISSLYRLGEFHTYKTNAGFFSGKIVSVTDSGCLQIEDRMEKIHQFLFKEVDFVL